MREIRNRARSTRSLGEIFKIPAALFAISLGGFILVLLIDGLLDLFAGIAAGIGIAAMFWRQFV